MYISYQSAFGIWQSTSHNHHVLIKNLSAYFGHERELILKYYIINIIIHQPQRKTNRHVFRSVIITTVQRLRTLKNPR